MCHISRTEVIVFMEVSFIRTNTDSCLLCLDPKVVGEDTVGR